MVVGLTPELVRPVPRDLILCQWPLKGEEKRLAHHKLNPSLPLQQVILTFLYFLQAHCEECCSSVGRVLYSGWKGPEFEPHHWGHCIVSMSKTLYPLLSTCSSNEATPPPPPPANFVVGILFSCCPSVRACVCPSVTFCFLNILKGHCWIFIKPCKHVHICKTNTLDKKVRARSQFYESYFPL